MEFNEACSEMCFIIENMEPSLKAKLPQSLIDFFYKNKLENYEVKLTTDKALYDQELKEETKAFIEIINKKYFMEPNEKLPIKRKEGNFFTRFLKKVVAFFKREKQE